MTEREAKRFPLKISTKKNLRTLRTFFSPTAGITSKSQLVSTSVFLITKVPEVIARRGAPPSRLIHGFPAARLSQSELSYSRSASKEANHSTSTKKASLRQRRQPRPRQSPLLRPSDIVRSRFAPLPNRYLARNALFHAVRGFNGPSRCVP